MAMRRPRIKAAANITSKRKPKSQSIEPNTKAVVNEKLNNDEKLNEDDSSIVKKDEINEKYFEEDVICDYQPKQGDTQSNNSVNISEDIPEVIAADEPPNNLEAGLEKSTEDNDVFMDKTEKDNISFKCPAKVDNSRTPSQSAISNNDDVFQTDIEENVIQMDLQKSVSGFPMSPSKTQSRQRIRATPVFQRRNSLMGSTLSAPSTPQAEDAPVPVELFAVPTHRRERHYSGSISQPFLNSASATHHHTPQKFIPTAGLGRIRTESGCSAFSDSYATSSKLRKTDDHNQRPRSQRDYDARFTRGVPDKSTLKMFELIYYNPVTNPMEQKPNISHIKKETSSIAEDLKDGSSDDVKLSTEKFNEDGTPNALPVPQLKLNSNGELILDDKSLEIETTAEQEARKVLANSSLIFLDENTGMNGFYKRQKRTKEWPPEETVKFYRCLQTIGTDFSLMCQLFPKRTRRDLKLKFKKEERCNGALINKALLYPKTFNVEDLKGQLETEERERAELERQWKEIKAKEAKAIKKINVTTSAAARVLKHGDDIYENENILKGKISKRAQSKNKAIAAKEVETSDLNNGSSQNDKAIKPKKRRRTRKMKKAIDTEDTECMEKNSSEIPIKTERIKSEHVAVVNVNESSSYVNLESTDEKSANVLESEISELLHGDNSQQEEFISYYKHSENPISDLSANYDNNDTINKTLVTFDNVNDREIISTPAATEIESTVASTTNANATGCELNELDETDDLDELDIQRILTELAEGSLVLVSTLDPDNADKVVNEIYMLDKNTGELCDKPLEIPEAIVQAILSVMS